MFSGSKVRLERPQIKDADILQQWYMDKDFRQLYDGYRGNTLDMITADIRDARDLTDPQATRFDFIVRSKHTRQPIGMAAIMDVDRQNGHAALALGIVDEEYRLAGFGLDLLIVLCDIVFYEFGFERCYMRVNEHNPLGLRTALSFGFKEEGRLRRHIFSKGYYQDQFILGLLKEEYENISIVSRWKARG